LQQNAYGMYLVHHVFVIWRQYALLPADLPAIIEAGTGFVATVCLSWRRPPPPVAFAHSPRQS
jgi:glucans biosynthesis protein C